MDEFWKTGYSMTIAISNDELQVTKLANGEWSHVRMITNGKANGDITIRSKEHAEGLHFMLGQMLDL